MPTPTVLYEFTHRDGTQVLVEGTTQGRALMRLCQDLYSGRVPTPLEAAKAIERGVLCMFMSSEEQSEHEAAVGAGAPAAAIASLNLGETARMVKGFEVNDMAIRPAVDTSDAQPPSNAVALRSRDHSATAML
jgi:hypothetical protein